MGKTNFPAPLKIEQLCLIARKGTKNEDDEGAAPESAFMRKGKVFILSSKRVLSTPKVNTSVRKLSPLW